MDRDELTAIQYLGDRRAIETGEDLFDAIERGARDIRHEVSLAAGAEHGGEGGDQLIERASDAVVAGVAAGGGDEACRGVEDRGDSRGGH